MDAGLDSRLSFFAIPPIHEEPMLGNSKLSLFFGILHRKEPFEIQGSADHWKLCLQLQRQPLFVSSSSVCISTLSAGILQLFLQEAIPGFRMDPMESLFSSICVLIWLFRLLGRSRLAKPIVLRLVRGLGEQPGNLSLIELSFQIIHLTSQCLASSTRLHFIEPTRSPH